MLDSACKNQSLTQSRVGFLDLPVEIRLSIYSLLLEDCEYDLAPEEYAVYTCNSRLDERSLKWNGYTELILARRRLYERCQLNMSSVCKQIRKECFDLVCRSAVFPIDAPRDFAGLASAGSAEQLYDRHRRALLDKTQRLPPESLQQVRRIALFGVSEDLAYSIDSDVMGSWDKFSATYFHELGKWLPGVRDVALFSTGNWDNFRNRHPASIFGDLAAAFPKLERIVLLFRLKKKDPTNNVLYFHHIQLDVYDLDDEVQVWLTRGNPQSGRYGGYAAVEGSKLSPGAGGGNICLRPLEEEEIKSNKLKSSPTKCERHLSVFYGNAKDAPKYLLRPFSGCPNKVPREVG